MKQKNNKGYIYIAVIAGYVLFAILGYWTLLSGMNHMKWDIWDAEYPAQVLMSDALAEGTIPMWNPLMLMGVPYYAIVGMPVWYPFTLILALIGYTPLILSIEYVMHIVIGAYGFFLLVKNHLEESSVDNNNLWIAFIAGLVFGSSGVFLSNAQHIMIVISAAWIPYVLYFTKRYLQEKRIYLGMLAGGAAGLIMLGGYPEMFYDLFLVLVPYTLYYNWKKEEKVWRNVAYAAGQYIIICIFTILCSAVSIIPFIKVMPYITRSAEVEQIVNTTPFYALISLVLPKASKLYTGVEISMCNFYTSVLAVLSIPYVFAKKNRKKLIYGGLLLFSFIMCWGENSPLYMLFHKFLPMYAAFRFPTVFRVFLSIFLILLVSEGWKDIIAGHVKNSVIFVNIGILLLSMIGWVTSCLIIKKQFVISWLTEGQMGYLQWGLGVLMIVSGLYLLLLVVIKYFKRKEKRRKVCFLAVVSIELLLFVFSEMPITIANYGSIEAVENATVKKKVRKVFKENKTRDRSIEFAGSARTSSALRSDLIVFEKTFDDAGYLSIKLNATENYKQTYNHSIIEANPEVYFTNDIITAGEIDGNTWCSLPTVSPMQIYIENPILSVSEMREKTRLEPVEVKSIKTENQIDGHSIKMKGEITPNRKRARLVKVYVDGREEKLQAQTIFKDINASESVFEGEYEVMQDERGHFIAVYFPQTTAAYSEVQVIIENTVPLKGFVFYTKRMSASENVEINHFGFNRLDVNVAAESDGYLTVLQSFYPGWHAYVDGEKVEIEKVNGCFMGIPLKAGKHNVVMQFKPLDFYIGAVISIGYLGILGVVLITYLKGKRKKEMSKEY